jgi:hypothetical protein
MIRIWCGSRSSGSETSARAEQRPRGRHGVLVAGVGVAIAIGGGAAAITDSKFLYEHPKKGYFTLSAGAFAPSKLNGTYSHDGYVIRIPTGNVARSCFVAGINLPHDSKIKGLTAILSNIDPVGNFDPELTVFQTILSERPDSRVILSAHLDDGVSLDPAVIEVEPLVAPDPRISNFDHSYAANLCLSDGDSFYGARLEYTYISAGD